MSNLTPETSDTGLPTLPRLPGSAAAETPQIPAPAATTPMTPPTLPGPTGSGPSMPTLPGVGTPQPPAPAAPAASADQAENDAVASSSVPAPPSIAPLSPPGLPGVAAPMLPPTADALPKAGAVPAHPPASAVAAPAAPATPATPVTPAAGSTTPPATRRSPLRLLVPLAFAAGFAALGYIGFQSMTAETEAEIMPATTVAPSSPLVAPINDAEAAVELINDNTIEGELLDEIGLDAAGDDKVVPDALPPAPSLVDVLPSFAPDALKTSTVEPDGSGRYVYDDAALAAASATERLAWLTRWNLDAQAPPAGDVTIDIVIVFGQVESATFDAPASAGSATSSFEVSEPAVAQLDD